MEDPLDRIQRSMVERGIASPKKTRGQKRAEAHPRGGDAGEGKHPEGATRPFREERRAKSRAKSKAARRARRKGKS